MIGVTLPVWLGDAAPFVSGLMIGTGTVGIAIGSFLEVLRINRS